MFGQRQHAVAFAGVVPGGNVGDAGLACQMHRLLGNLAAEIEIDAERDGLLEQSLRAPRTPADAAHPAFAVTESAAASAATRRRRARRPGATRWMGLLQVAQPADFLLAEARVGHPAESPGQLRVVAELGMAIERQMVGNEVDVVLEQRLQAHFADAGDRPSSPRQNQP
jgi:hypothetical protein